MANPTGKGGAKKGEVRNPQGRPKGSKNKRTIAEAIKKALLSEMPIGGKSYIPNEAAAEVIARCYAFGLLQFPQETKPQVLSYDQWKDFVAFVAKHIDPPHPKPVEVSGPGGGTIEFALTRYAEAMTELSEDEFIGVVTTTLDDFQEGSDSEAEAEEP